jgi:hypothetical protein
MVLLKPDGVPEIRGTDRIKYKKKLEALGKHK